MNPSSVLRRPRARLARVVSAGLAASAVALLGASGASAAPPTGIYADFNHCPVAAASVSRCLYTRTTSGSFKLGNATVPINKSILLQGGYEFDENTGSSRFVAPTDGTPALQQVPLDVPGGLTGLVIPSQVTSIPILGPLFTAAVNSVNGVKATAELVAPVNFNYINYVSSDGPAITLPVRIKLSNPFLGDQCYIGSASKPVTLRLTTGTTAPPAPNTPVSGYYGDLEFPDDGNLITGTNFRLVDNAFSVPAAQNCGPVGLQFLLTPIVNLKEGFPSAAGNNSATLQGDLKIGLKSSVVASSN
jgi:hypothetical protein